MDRAAPDLSRKLAAEALGTLLLLAAIVGSGIMAERLCGGNAGLALLANTIATGAALVVLILTFGPVSGAHFNPAVTVAMGLRREIGVPDAIAYMAAQVTGAIAGVWLAHLMFGEPLLQIGTADRSGMRTGLAEFVAAFGLVAVILGCARHRAAAVPAAVGLYITAAYWFTSSTSFANPAVTVARALTATFSGIRPDGVTVFIAAQFLGAAAAVAVMGWLVGRPSCPAVSSPTPSPTRPA